MSTSLYVPCFNAHETISSCLEGVLKQTCPLDEVLVLDDASVDDTIFEVVKYPIRVIRHQKNQGLAMARNTAIENLNGNFIASLDRDCVPEPDWMELLMSRFDADDIAGVGGRVIEKYSTSIFDHWRTAHMKQYWEAETSSPPFLFGANTVFRKSALEKVGFYNPKYRHNYEDVDLCERLTKQGYRFVYEPMAIVYHVKQDNLYSILNNYWRWYIFYYEQEGFFDNERRFEDKIKDSIGLANRLMEEDLEAGRHELLYLDFLLALHHCLRDFVYYFLRKDSQGAGFPIRSFWFSLIDLTFFYHYDSSKKEYSSVLNKTHAFIQNFYALLFLIGQNIKGRFENENKEFHTILCKHLLQAVFGVQDNQLAKRLGLLILRRNDWGRFLEKKHPHINVLFLEKMARHFNKWLNDLVYNRPRIISKIIWAAEKTDKEMIV